MGVTGGIASYKVLELCSRLKKAGANLQIIMTEGACQFVSPLAFETMGKCKVYTDIFAGHHDQVLHIELPRRCDCFIIAPLTANTMAKMANGIADNFLTSAYLACDKPVIVAPSMNTNMLHNPATIKNLETLKDFGVKVISPESGLLACDTVGDGRMEEPENIVDFLDYFLTEKDLLGKKIIVTAGPTVEKIDFVRYITNRSSGKMGYSIAKAARNRGADVTLISGPVSPFEIRGIDLRHIDTNAELTYEIEREFDTCDSLIMAAAPVDYRPLTVYDKKMKKTGENLNLELTENPDILKSFGEKKQGQKIIGFAAETDNTVENAKKKLLSKNADYIILNDLTAEGAGFEVDTNVASIVSKEGIKNLSKMTKMDLANVILDLI